MKSMMQRLVLVLGIFTVLTGKAFYDPSCQRWISLDPIGEQGGVNLYGFAQNDPANRADAYGLWPYRDVPTGPPRTDLASRQLIEIQRQADAAIALGIVDWGAHLIIGLGQTVADGAAPGLAQFGLNPGAIALENARAAVDRGLELATKNFTTEQAYVYAYTPVFLDFYSLMFPIGLVGKESQCATMLASESRIPQFIYRTGSQTENALTDAAGVSFRDSISSSANRVQIFEPGAKIWAVDTSKLPPRTVVLDGNPAGHVSVLATPSKIQAAIVPQSPANPLSDLGLKLLEDGSSYRIPKK